MSKEIKRRATGAGRGERRNTRDGRLAAAKDGVDPQTNIGRALSMDDYPPVRRDHGSRTRVRTPRMAVTYDEPSDVRDVKIDIDRLLAELALYSTDTIPPEKPEQRHRGTGRGRNKKFFDFIDQRLPGFESDE